MCKLKQCNLLIQINKLRDKMIKTGLEKGLNSNETIKLSKDLDQLLYTYQLQYQRISR
jgi:flagellin-specific chaperone FliS